VKVEGLKLKVPRSVMPNVTCQDAIEIMKAEGYDQLPVADGSG
jgi:predicted transcriptional regulator